MSGPDRKVVCVKMPAYLFEELKKLATELGTTRSEIVRDAIRAYLALRKQLQLKIVKLRS